MQKYVEEELELEPKTIAMLHRMAEDCNTTVDNVVNDILRDFISKKVTLDEFRALINNNNHEELRGYFIVNDNDGNAIFRTIPV